MQFCIIIRWCTLFLSSKLIFIHLFSPSITKLSGKIYLRAVKLCLKYLTLSTLYQANHIIFLCVGEELDHSPRLWPCRSRSETPDLRERWWRRLKVNEGRDPRQVRSLRRLSSYRLRRSSGATWRILIPSYLIIVI